MSADPQDSAVEAEPAVNADPSVTHDVKLLYGTYEVLNTGPYGRRPRLQYFGRLRDGRSITLLYDKFYPYFYIVEPQEEAVQKLRGDRQVVDLEIVDKTIAGRPVKAAKVTLCDPRLTRRYREEYDGVSADIVFRSRFLYDKDLSSCVRVTGREVEKDKFRTDLVVDIDAIQRAENFTLTRYDSNGQPVGTGLKIMSFDLENLQDDTIVCIGVVLEMPDGVRRDFVLRGPEPELLEQFRRLVIEEDVDILSGYNIANYDLPLLERRFRYHGIPMNMSRNGWDVAIRTARAHAGGDKWVDKGTNTTIEIPGRLVVDSWYFARKEKRPPRETLGAMSTAILGRTKLDVDTSKMDEEWQNNEKLVLEYCMQDTRLSHDILKAIRVLDKYDAVSMVAGLPLFDCFLDRNAVLIDSLLIREADKAGEVVPNNRYGEEESESIIGGYVHEPIPGLHDDVIIMDFASLYPSVIIENNLCFTTLSENGTITSPVGAKFLSRDVKVGLLPKVLTRLLQAREDSKNRMKVCLKAGDSVGAEYYDSLQKAQKIMANAHYGVFASRFYRFTDKRIGGSVTGFGQQYTKNIISTLDAQGMTVVYSDTDSIFVLAPKSDKTGDERLAELKKIAEDLSTRFSAGHLKLEYEKTVSPLFLSTRKKRYFGKIIHPKQEVIVRGFETRRGDTFPLLTRSMDTVFGMIMDRKQKEAFEYAVAAVHSALQGDPVLEDLIISKTVQDILSYKVMYRKATGERIDPASRMPHLQAAKKAKLNHRVEIPPGMKVSWVVTNAQVSPQEVQPYIDGIKFRYQPDYRYYAEKLTDAFLRVLDVFGYTKEQFIPAKPRKSRKKKSDQLSLGLDEPSPAAPIPILQNPDNPALEATGARER